MTKTLSNDHEEFPATTDRIEYNARRYMKEVLPVVIDLDSCTNDDCHHQQSIKSTHYLGQQQL